jgi:acetyl esterase/lipase
MAQQRARVRVKQRPDISRRSRHRYGAHRSQVGDLWLPSSAEADGAKVPVIVLMHGGYWRSLYTKSLMNGLARAVVDRGWAAWNIEYRRVGAFGGGGWPQTFEDVSAAVDHVDVLPFADPTRVVTFGHSAGGQLALWVAARNRAASSVPAPVASVQPRAAVALAGVIDLVRGAELGLGNGAVQALLGGSPEQWPERYGSGSPVALLPLGTPQILIHGQSDSVVPPSMSERYERSASAAGDDVTYVRVAGADHRGLIDPRGAAWPIAARLIEELLAR